MDIQSGWLSAVLCTELLPIIDDINILGIGLEQTYNAGSCVEILL